jgi:hypothetical protein
MAKSLTRTLTAAVTLLFVVSLPPESDAQFYMGPASGTWDGYYSYSIVYINYYTMQEIASFSGYGIPTTLSVNFSEYGAPNSSAVMSITNEFSVDGFFTGTFGAQNVNGTISRSLPFGGTHGDLDANFVSILPSGLIDTTDSIAVADTFFGSYFDEINIGDYHGPGYIYESASFGPQQFPEPSSVVLAITAVCTLACWACMRSLLRRRSRAHAAQ